jgi:hypothetical protein
MYSGYKISDLIMKNFELEFVVVDSWVPLPAAGLVGSAVAAQVAQLETSSHTVVVSVAAVAFVVSPAQRSILECLISLLSGCF